MIEINKRFLVFAGTSFYPGGGWCDFHSAHETAADAIETAKQIVIGRTSDWSHVVDISVSKEIKVFYQVSSARERHMLDVYAFDTFEVDRDGDGGFTNGTLVHSARAS